MNKPTANMNRRTADMEWMMLESKCKALQDRYSTMQQQKEQKNKKKSSTRRPRRCQSDSRMQEGVTEFLSVVKDLQILAATKKKSNGNNNSSTQKTTVPGSGGRPPRHHSNVVKEGGRQRRSTSDVPSHLKRRSSTTPRQQHDGPRRSISYDVATRSRRKQFSYRVEEEEEGEDNSLSTMTTSSLSCDDDDSSPATPRSRRGGVSTRMESEAFSLDPETPTRRKVSFLRHPITEVKTIPYTREEDISNLFYSPEETNRFKKQNRIRKQALVDLCIVEPDTEDGTNVAVAC
mmetsp:Transcript_98813/g.137202  ORF Transcript_98813/g.137202 Transcript_98813/m.137202 type:complete len:290 (-) Transcript_98813:329-1198(-)